MSITAVTLNPSAGSQTSSPYGINPWYSAPSHFDSYIPINDGSGWIVFQIQVPGLTLGEVFNGVRIVGSHDFLVGGGSGVFREATGQWRIGASVASFIGAAADGTFGPVNGSGVSQSLNFVATKGGFTSTDIVNGTMYLGFAVSSNGLSAIHGPAWYRNFCLNTTFFCGPDSPFTPPASTYATLVNPTSNTTPGKPPGAQFDPMNLTYTQPIPQANIQFRWTISGAGLTWVSSGTGLLVQSQGTAGNPGSPYFNTTSPINISAATPPGTYNMQVWISGAFITDLFINTSVVVAGPGGGQFWEF